MQPPLWHAEPVPQVVRRLGTDPARGLSAAEAERRLAQHGPNRLPEGERVHPAALFFRQFRDFMVLVLLGAGVVSFLLGEAADGAAILAILLLNAFFGFVQEFRAERSLQALQRLAAPTATALRDGVPVELPADRLVPGDILLISDGDRVPADGRLLWASALEVDESLLTGESLPVAKDPDAAGAPEQPVADRKNMLFMGTAVTRGRARLVVTATGSATQIGQIAELIRGTGAEPTPLQQRLEHLGRRLVWACFVIVAAVFAVGVWRGFPVYRMFLTGVSLAVAAIPEGLPAVVTAALAIGVQRMIQRRAIVRRLPAVETLGCVNVICTDKTGTLTKNEMTVVHLWVPDREIAVTGTGYAPYGTFAEGQKAVDPKSDPRVRLALEIGLLCNAASLVCERKADAPAGEVWRVVGDPTEGALVVAAAKAGLDPSRWRRRYPVEHENPFDPQRRRMSVVVNKDGVRYAYVKGAPGAVLERCTHVLTAAGVEALTPVRRRAAEDQVDAYARAALRVIGLAYRELPGPGREEAACEERLVFVGLAAMFDPPREDVGRAVQKSRRAGIRTLMLTGDHPATALAIARSVGLVGPGARVITGQEVDAMSDAALAEAVTRVDCFARVSPAHKLRIVRTLRRTGALVAMTGDGVNDAPAVKEADIGISMGLTGADVTKEASDIVLADDNYATIVAAVEEGRAIYENIRKFIRYLLGCNAGEVLTMLAALVVGLPLPLLPLQILWMNLVTDGLPALALGVDPPDPANMQRGPRPVREGIFARNLWKKVLLSGAAIGGSTLLVFAGCLWLRPGAEDWARSMAFTTLVVSQLVYAFQCRFEHRPAARTGLFANVYLLGAVAVSFGMQLAVLYAAPLQAAFRTVPLTGPDWLVVLAASGWGFTGEQAVRLLRTRLLRRLAWVRV